MQISKTGVKINPRKMIFTICVSYLLALIVSFSTGDMQKHKEPYITNKFVVYSKQCKDVVADGKEVNRCFLSDGKEWHWVTDSTYKTHKVGDTVKFVEYRFTDTFHLFLFITTIVSSYVILSFGWYRLDNNTWE